MLRTMRWTLGALWSFVAALLRRFADLAHLRAAEIRNDGLASDLFAAQHEIRQLKSDKAILEAQVKQLTEWQHCELERKRTEKEIEIGKRIVGRPDRED